MRHESATSAASSASPRRAATPPQHVAIHTSALTCAYASAGAAPPVLAVDNLSINIYDDQVSVCRGEFSRT
jgi:hypothetical protein